MLWILVIVGVIGIIYNVVSFFIELFSSSKWYLKDAAILTIIFAVIATISIFALAGVFSLDYEIVEKTDEIKLVSLQDSSQINGSAGGGAFYVYASVGSEEVYTYYYQLENGGYKRGKICADNAIIFEKDNCNPEIIEYTTYQKNKLGGVIRGILTFDIPESKSYEIYVPKGTVLSTFVLDSE